MTITIPTGATVFGLAGADGTPANIPQQFGGQVTNGNTYVPVPYNNVNLAGNKHPLDGAAKLDAAMAGVDGQKIVLAHSEGAIACAAWLLNQAQTTTITPDELFFVLTGNSVRPFGGFCYYTNWYPGIVIPSETVFTVYDWVAQYDKYGDYPPGTDPKSAGQSSGDANLNIMSSSEHSSYPNRDLNSPNAVTLQLGNISYIWDMTYPAPLCGSNQNKWAAQDQKYRPLIEAGYQRGPNPANPVIIPTPNYSDLG